jgi:hypothetical protein
MVSPPASFSDSVNHVAVGDCEADHTYPKAALRERIAADIERRKWALVESLAQGLAEHRAWLNAREQR